MRQNDTRLAVCYRLGCAMLPIALIGYYVSTVLMASAVAVMVLTIAYGAYRLIARKHSDDLRGLELVNSLLALPYALFLSALVYDGFIGTVNPWVAYGIPAFIAIADVVGSMLPGKAKDSIID